MRRMQSLNIFAICAAATIVAACQASAALVGGTYTNGGAPTTSWPATAQVTNSPIRYKSGVDPTASPVTQGFTAEIESGSGALISEIVTPTTSFKLDTISIEGGGAAPLPTGMSLHLYTIGSHTGSNPPSTFSDFVSQPSAFYFADTDLLGGGNGLAFSVAGFPSASLINFTLDNTGTSDQVTLSAGTSYAIELWNRSSPYALNTFTWVRNGVADPNGQAFAKNSSIDFSTSRNTIAANGLAGGAPRTFQIALYGTATGSIVGDYNQNGVVDAADYIIWRDTLGQNVTPGSGADGNSSGVIDSGDYTVWKSAFGTGPGAGAAATAIPEPASLIPAAIAAICGLGIAIARGRSRRTA